MDSSPSSSSSGDSSRVSEWELGLPSADDLTPLSQSLISPFLASAFSIPSHLPSAAGIDSNNRTDEFDDAPPAKKRPRLVWTPQLHRRFVEVVACLGIKNAVPKAIVEMMNVEGLTRENVASHLQKYRMFVKRVQPGPDPKPDLNSQLQQQQQQPATVMMPLFQNYGSYGGGGAGGYYGN